jgi:REP element-mobilizing transposase RayT
LNIGDVADTIDPMGKMVGFMVTWTTYGTWLQGDRRRYVREGQILPPDAGLEQANKKMQKSCDVWLTDKQRMIAEEAILKESQRIKQEILALAVRSNPIHLVVKTGNESIENTVSRYKNVATCALKKTGLTEKIWTRGFDKQFCFNDEELNRRIEYVNRHNKTD